MPRVRRRSRRRTLTEAHVYQLLTGRQGFCQISTDGFGRDSHNSTCDWPALREAWGNLRKELIELWILKYPGSRPDCWWALDAPAEPRRRVDGKPHPFESPDHLEGLWYGTPRYLRARDDFATMYESETDYLSRCGLLTDVEKAALDADPDLRCKPGQGPGVDPDDEWLRSVCHEVLSGKRVSRR